MRKLQKRAIICLFFAAILILGCFVYTGLLAVNGGDWVSYPANKHIYTNGKLTTGTIKDRNGEVLLSNTYEGGQSFNDNYSLRKANLHITGDKNGNIATGANVVFGDKLVGYNFVTGVYSMGGKGRTMELTIDSRVNQVANDALGGRKGTVGVYNYKTGEIICMVSSPNYDPLYPPANNPDDNSGAFLNRMVQSKIVPGSIFKLVTSMAAIESLSDLSSFTYTCTGSRKFGSYDGDRVSCTHAHGTVDFKKALAVSCNCAFAELSMKLGPEKLEEYTKKAGMMSSYSINGIKTAKGSFEFPNTDVSLAWTGIGQHKDLVNPTAMMVYMGAIANEGKAANPKIIKNIKFNNGLPASFPIKTKTDELIDPETAATLKAMMRNNVTETYGEGNFPGLDICAKSGTAEVDKVSRPNAWFTGFLRDEENPYAFIVLVENGGYGSQVAGSVANTVLQAIVD